VKITTIGIDLAKAAFFRHRGRTLCGLMQNRGYEGNRLQIRLGGPYFTVFLVNRMLLTCKTGKWGRQGWAALSPNSQMGLAGMGGLIAQLAKSVLAQPNFASSRCAACLLKSLRFDSSSPTGS
jgi:hypothetical protein